MAYIINRPDVRQYKTSTKPIQKNCKDDTDKAGIKIQNSNIRRNTMDMYET